MGSAAAQPWGSVASSANGTCPYCSVYEGQLHQPSCVIGLRQHLGGKGMRFDTCPDCGEGTCEHAAPDSAWNGNYWHNVNVKHGYFPLFSVLNDALNEAQNGKGSERHGNGLSFTEQPALTITRAVGLGFPLGQAMKKIQESQRMDPDAAKRELLGAINYLAAAVLFLDE
jgi:methionyl-tRNA synthetase